MTALSTVDRFRLAKVLAMLGSKHDGERAAAGLLATRMVQSAGTDWTELLAVRGCCQRHHSGADVSSPPTTDMGLCVRNLERLTVWEQDFILSLRGRLSLSPGQREKLGQIAAVLRKAGLS